MEIPYPIPFTKMSGTGNDFILIDHRIPFLDEKDMPHFVRALCRRKFSVGADGLIFIVSSAEADFAWKFFNADGSAAEMCGNGARCAARFAFIKNIAPAKMRFLTMAGIIEAEVRDGSVKIKMTQPSHLLMNHDIHIEGRDLIIHGINTGVPHAVLFVDDVRIAPVFGWGRTIRRHPMFQPAGANANFAQVDGPSHLLVRTYERGVEDETMACGTGAVAAALLGFRLGLVAPPVEVTTSGGERLIIHFEWEKNAPLCDEVHLEGPAHIIYHGEVRPEAFHQPQTGLTGS